MSGSRLWRAGDVGMTVSILIGDVRDHLAELPADHFDCVVTSPPYWGLRLFVGVSA